MLGTSHELLDAMDRPIVGVDKLCPKPLQCLPPLRTWHASAETESLPNNMTVPNTVSEWAFAHTHGDFTKP